MIVLLVGIVSLASAAIGWILRGLKGISDIGKGGKKTFRKSNIELLEWQPPKEVDKKKQEEILKHNLQK